ncbi:hypothetical protein IB267_31925 [Ensifer sp. ENS09]|uniref:hypothetical protein n=2 Tax=unclassified Ensifer TaxID=2633371 RepID=UPI0017864D22|nr:hypothetical protein [Ensifer sp. ENS09]MBD9652976.1 hypothetical protein [Ensifer sp. ENS09]
MLAHTRKSGLAQKPKRRTLFQIGNGPAETPGRFSFGSVRPCRVVKSCSTPDKERMLADDLKNVLEELYRAGAHRVPAEDIDWPQDLHAAVFRALNMQYMIRRQDDAGRVEFSLTRAGYAAIDAEVPWSQILRTRLRDFLPFAKSR